MRGTRHLIFLVAVCCQLTLASSCLSQFKSLSKMVLDKSLLIGLVAAGAWAGSEVTGVATRTPLIGFSIYFDYENILSYLKPEERALLNAPKKQPEKIIEILNQYLSRDNRAELDVYPYLKPVMASQYFSKSPPKTNVCRHKALILKAMLNHLGIPAVLRTGTVDGDNGQGEHVWVYLPDIKKVADPMNNLLVDEVQYGELFNPTINWGTTHFAKPIGSMAR